MFSFLSCRAPCSVPGQGLGTTPPSEAQGCRFFVVVQYRPADALLSPEPRGDQGTLFARNVVHTGLLFLFLFFTHIYFPASGQTVVTGVVPSPLRFLPSNFIAHGVQQSHCSSIFHRVLLTHALALSASQFVHKKKSPQIYASMHSGGF